MSRSIGERLVVGGKAFRVVGKTAEGRYYFGVPTVFVSLKDAQEIVFKGQPLAMGIAVKGTARAPAGTTTALRTRRWTATSTGPSTGACSRSW